MYIQAGTVTREWTALDAIVEGLSTWRRQTREGTAAQEPFIGRNDYAVGIGLGSIRESAQAQLRQCTQIIGL